MIPRDEITGSVQVHRAAHRSRRRLIARHPGHRQSIPRGLINEVQLFRIRVATAESRLKLLREEARQARRRRKEAKRMAQRARKRFKRSKSDLAELRQALAKAETKLFRAGERALARKMARSRPVLKGGARPPKQALAHRSKPLMPQSSRL